jgi:repressor LexA
LGVIAAGQPIETYEQPETLAFPEFAGARNVFALEVRGESMIEDHIVEGDYVLVEQTDRVRNGEIVVALVDGAETTLKRFYSEPDGTVRLQPANSAMAPIRVPAGQVAVQGRVLAVHRRYR